MSCLSDNEAGKITSHWVLLSQLTDNFHRVNPDKYALPPSLTIPACCLRGLNTIAPKGGGAIVGQANDRHHFAPGHHMECSVANRTFGQRYLLDGLHHFRIVWQRIQIHADPATVVTVGVCEHRLPPATAHLITIAYVYPIVIADAPVVFITTPVAVGAERATVASRQQQRDIHPIIVGPTEPVTVCRQVHADTLRPADLKIPRQRNVIAIVVRLIPIRLVIVVKVMIPPLYRWPNTECHCTINNTLIYP